MKKGKFDIKMTVIRRGQELIAWIPYIFLAIFAGFILSAAFRHKSAAINHIRSLKTSLTIAKDPNCRHQLKLSSANYSLDYEDETPDPIVPVPETWKEPGLLTLPDFRWVMNNESICQKDSDVPADTKVLPVLVRSWRNQFSQRKVIRESWGALPIYKGWDLRLIFMMGQSENDDEKSREETEELKREQEKYGDLVMGSFPDNNKNATFKGMMGYKWVLNFCQDADFVMIVESERFTDIIQWIDWRSEDLEKLKNYKEPEDSFEDKPIIPDLYCHIISGNAPMRSESSIYYAPKEDWPEDFYYDYCQTWAYGISVDLMKKIYSVSLDRKFFYIEDVFVGGLLDLVKKKYDWIPGIKESFNMEEVKIEKYRGICGEDGTTHFEKKKEFGPVVEVDGGKYEQDVTCLWKKTAQDSGITI